MAIIGQTLATDADDQGDQFTRVYTPAFPRQGHGITSIVEAIVIPDDTKLSVQAQTANQEEADAESGWSNLGSPVEFTNPVSSAETDQEHATGVKELVRYQVTLSTTATAVPQFAHFRILNPSWQTTGAQSI